MRLSTGTWVGAACLLAGAVAQEQFAPMEFVMPLYIAPTYPNGTIAAQWVALHDTAATGATVFGILNPASGPGTTTADNYTATIDYVKGAGAKLLCYVATTYGNKTTQSVEEEIMAYVTLYPGACDGMFFDESPHLLADFLDIYAAHNTFAHATLDGATEEARIVFNTGQAPDEQYYAFTPPAEVLGFENYYKTVRQLGMPETSDVSTASQNMLLLHSATELANKTELIQSFVNKAYCKGWGTIYVTDDLFDVGNPWDDPPTFWMLLVEAATNIPTVESCGGDGIKVLAPLLSDDPADIAAIIASADPGDYGDRITVAMNVEITATAESTTTAAAVRDAGAKVLCYIGSDMYSNNLTLLEDALVEFTYFPLNEICAGFFFGAFNIMAAIEDIAGLQSLYVKTQRTFLQATVVFAPEVQDTDGDEIDFSYDFSYSYDYSYSYEYNYEYNYETYDIDSVDATDEWDSGTLWDSGAEFVFPWDDVMTPTDLVALAEALTTALDVGSTTGDIIVADTLDGASTLPAASGPAKHTAAMVVGYSGAPEDAMFDLYAKEYGYGYVTEFYDFEALATQWAAVVNAAADTEAFVAA